MGQIRPAGALWEGKNDAARVDHAGCNAAQREAMRPGHAFVSRA
jgi:hypothetical protein